MSTVYLKMHKSAILHVESAKVLNFLVVQRLVTSSPLAMLMHSSFTVTLGMAVSLSHTFLMVSGVKEARGSIIDTSVCCTEVPRCSVELGLEPVSKAQLYALLAVVVGDSFSQSGPPDPSFWVQDDAEGVKRVPTPSK